jgi:hypothetical protein
MRAGGHLNGPFRGIFGPHSPRSAKPGPQFLADLARKTPFAKAQESKLELRSSRSWRYRSSWRAPERLYGGGSERDEEPKFIEPAARAPDRTGHRRVRHSQNGTGSGSAERPRRSFRAGASAFPMRSVPQVLTVKCMAWFGNDLPSLSLSDPTEPSVSSFLLPGLRTTESRRLAFGETARHDPLQVPPRYWSTQPDVAGITSLFSLCWFVSEDRPHEKTRAADFVARDFSGRISAQTEAATRCYGRQR